MPTVLSKTLPYSCHEIGHTWNPSCIESSTEIFISAFIYSCQMYSFVYAVTAALDIKSLDLKGTLKLLANYLRSSLFLSTNAVGYISFFCILRHILGHVNYLTGSFVPGFLSALAAILVERPSRRSLLAVYVANVASECAFKACVGWGYIKPVPKGDVLLFSISLAILGYFYHSSENFPGLIGSIFRKLVGPLEQGQQSPPTTNNIPPPPEAPQSSRWKRLLALLKSRHKDCPHSESCLHYMSSISLLNGSKALLLSYSLSLLFTLPTLIRKPSSAMLPIYRSLTSLSHLQFAALVAWFCGAYRSVCCIGRRGQDGYRAWHGAFAGAVAALGMNFYSMPSLASYVAWKTLEILVRMGVAKGQLPQVPYATEMLYCFMTGYLFHVAAFYPHYMKTSYWKMLLSLTNRRMAHYNRHLLYPFNLDSGRNFMDFWPEYQKKNVSSTFWQKFGSGIQSIPGYF